MFANIALINELFRGFYIQRWNDRIRPMDLIEMDKHAHKMVIAYIIARYEEDNGRQINWLELIKGGIFELLRRIIISDIKSPIYSRIKENPIVFSHLNKYVFYELESKIENEILKEELRKYLFNLGTDDDLTHQILEAAHIFASFWEFQIIKQANPNSYQNTRIETELLNKLDKYKHLIGIFRLVNHYSIYNFVDLIGQLRFQIRWAQTPRIPRTSVLGHSLLVACISYLFARENKACPKRLYNDFFGGLFHDLPEAVTRDIISPVKRSSEELEALLKEIENELADEQIYPLLENNWIEEIKYFTNNEFANKLIIDGEEISNGISIEDINSIYNQDMNNPYDGELIKAADELAAFLEAYHSIAAGIKSKELSRAKQAIKDNYISKTLGTLKINILYESFPETI